MCYLCPNILYTSPYITIGMYMKEIKLAYVYFHFALAVILGKSHYLLYVLATAMQPRWLVTLDENLQPLNVSVRVGQVIHK